MTTHATNHPIRMVYYVPVLSPLHVLATVALALPYRSLILSLQRRLPLQNRPWLNAALALTITFTLGTALATGIATVGVRRARQLVSSSVCPC
jgi:hypothetical protein